MLRYLGIAALAALVAAGSVYYASKSSPTKPLRNISGYLSNVVLEWDGQTCKGTLNARDASNGVAEFPARFCQSGASFIDAANIIQKQIEDAQKAAAKAREEQLKKAGIVPAEKK